MKNLKTDMNKKDNKMKFYLKQIVLFQRKYKI